MKAAVLALLLLGIPALCAATTAPDLSARINIDGYVDEYEPDEWVLDTRTLFRETPDDSRWGTDNDITRIAVTWDFNYLYIAVEANNYSSVLMTFLEHGNNGISDLVSLAALRRNIVFSSITPNLVIEANRAEPEARMAVVSIVEPPRYINSGLFRSRFYQPARGPGALEVALPWESVLPSSGLIKVLAAVTAGSGTGAGDAAPDPSALLQSRRMAQASLDNAISITVDRNYDGQADIGVSPRSEATFNFAQAKPRVPDSGFVIELGGATMALDSGVPLSFWIEAVNLDEPAQFYMTCEVYSLSGDRVRVLFRDELRLYEPGVKPPEDTWDGRNDSGEYVDGGIYILNVSSGVSPGTSDHVTRKPVSVVR